MSSYILPTQLTVGELRRLIDGVPDGVVVAMVLPPTAPRSDDLTLLLNLDASYAGGNVLRLRPSTVDADSSNAGHRLSSVVADATRAPASAILALERRGFVVTCERSAAREAWEARRDDIRARADDPLSLLGLVELVDHCGLSWTAPDNELSEVRRRFQRP